jgi:hypothetical protein
MQDYGRGRILLLGRGVTLGSPLVSPLSLFPGSEVTGNDLAGSSPLLIAAVLLESWPAGVTLPTRIVAGFSPPISTVVTCGILSGFFGSGSTSPPKLPSTRLVGAFSGLLCSDITKFISFLPVGNPARRGFHVRRLKRGLLIYHVSHQLNRLYQGILRKVRR